MSQADEPSTKEVLEVLTATFLMSLSFHLARVPLHPIFGSVASDQYHHYIFYGLILLLIVFKPNKAPKLSAALTRASLWLAAHPLTLYPVFRYSIQLGPLWGPIVAQFVLGVPIVVDIARPVFKTYGRVQAAAVLFFMHETLGRWISPIADKYLREYSLFVVAEAFTIMTLVTIPLDLPQEQSSSQAATPSKSQKIKKQQKKKKRPLMLYHLVGYLVFVSTILVIGHRFTVPRIISPIPWGHADTQGPHTLASRQSTTGRISVVEYDMDGKGSWVRALKADHSLLGGLWIGPARQQVLRQTKKSTAQADLADEIEAVKMAQSIYSTFHIQEAVRFVERPFQSTTKERGLVIGLGTGISTRALSAHGVAMAVSEIDPAVFQFARQYFGVPNPTAGVYLEDARQTLLRPDLGSFDYIIHDVFTGGALPATLFTQECWQDVKSALKPQGVLAVNFAGELRSKASLSIMTTLLGAFQSCRAFDDGSPGDFKNLVIFCADVPQISFRQLQIEDYLGSPSRRHVLEHFTEREVDLSTSNLPEGDVITDRNSKELEKLQRPSALHHWHTLREYFDIDFWMS